MVSHQNAPVPSIEICVRHDLQNVGNAIAQTLDRLNLTSEDLTWIDPQYDREFQLDIAPIVSLEQFIAIQYDRLINTLNHISKSDYIGRFIELDCHGHVWKDKVYQELVEEFKIKGLSWQMLLQDYEHANYLLLIRMIITTKSDLS